MSRRDQPHRLRCDQGDWGQCHQQADLQLYYNCPACHKWTDTDQYSHILDENRKENAILLENAFYNKKVTEPQPESEPEEETQPEKITAETIQNLLNDPNMVELLRKLSKTVAN